MPTAMSLAGRCGGSCQTLRACCDAVERALAVMVEHAPDDIFGHVLRQVVGDDPHDRHLRQAGIGEDVVDAGADREDRPEVGQASTAGSAAASTPRRR